MSRIMDAQIAADMALAAMDNRESWDALTFRQRNVMWVFADGNVQPRGVNSGAPLHLAARATMEAGQPVWVLED